MRLSVLFGSMAIIGLAVVFAAGCKKSGEVKVQGNEQQTQQAAVHSEQAGAVETAAASGEQTVCPVMGGTINKEIKTEYKGKTVYFCCGGCKPEFEKDPEKYISKLPQFGK